VPLTAVFRAFRPQLLNQATRLQQAFDEQSTANILLCLGVQQGQGEGSADPSLVEKLKLESNLDVASLKGNIIDQLRSKVRCEAAKQKQLGKEMLRIKSSSMGFATSGDGSSSPMKRQRTGSITSVDPATSSSAAHMDAEVDLETGEVDPDTIQPLPKSVVNWKNGTVSSEDGVERKLSDEEMEILRFVSSSVTLSHIVSYPPILTQSFSPQTSP
jgi:hypothetical protein